MRCARRGALKNNTTNHSRSTRNVGETRKKTAPPVVQFLLLPVSTVCVLFYPKQRPSLVGLPFGPFYTPTRPVCSDFSWDRFHDQFIELRNGSSSPTEGFYLRTCGQQKWVSRRLLTLIDVDFFARSSPEAIVARTSSPPL